MSLCFVEVRSRKTICDDGLVFWKLLPIHKMTDHIICNTHAEYQTGLSNKNDKLRCLCIMLQGTKFAITSAEEWSIILSLGSALNT